MTTPYKHLSGLIIAGSILCNLTLTMASEWRAFGTNNAEVISGDGRLVLHCQNDFAGQQPWITYFVKPNTKISQRGRWNIYVEVGGRLKGGGWPVNFNNGFWEMGTSTKGYLKNLKAGSKIIFEPQKGQRLTFPLKGSSKALDKCFAQAADSQKFTTSKVDILGLRTGMSFQNFVENLPQKFNKNHSSLRDSNITFHGNGGATSTRVNFKASGFWQVQDRDLLEHFKVTIAPDFLGKRITTIERSLSYETYRQDSKAPLTRQVIDALRKKYGAPYWEKPEQNSKGEMWFVFGKNETKSWFTSAPYPCQGGLKLNGPQWGFAGSDKSMAQFKNQYGVLSEPECGPYIKVTYRSDGARLRSLVTTLVDVPLIDQLMQEAYITLRAETKRKEKAVEQNASGNTPKL